MRSSKGSTFLESFLLLELPLCGCRVYSTLSVFRHDLNSRKLVDVKSNMLNNFLDRYFSRGGEVGELKS